MFFAQIITQVADTVVGLCAVMVFVIFNVVSRTKDDRDTSLWKFTRIYDRKVWEISSVS